MTRKRKVKKTSNTAPKVDESNKNASASASVAGSSKPADLSQNSEDSSSDDNTAQSGKSIANRWELRYEGVECNNKFNGLIDLDTPPNNKATSTKPAALQSAPNAKYSDIAKITTSSNSGASNNTKPTKTVLDKVRDRITNKKSKILLILRGLPGSGKTYLATNIKKQMGSGVILAPEDYFKNVDRHYGTKDKSFKWLDEQVVSHMKSMTNPIIIDNVHAKAQTMIQFVESARNFRYYVMIEEPETSWKHDVLECLKRTSHYIDKEKMKQIKQRYDVAVTVDGILGMIKHHKMSRGMPFEVNHRRSFNSTSSSNLEESEFGGSQCDNANSNTDLSQEGSPKTLADHLEELRINQYLLKNPRKGLSKIPEQMVFVSQPPVVEKPSALTRENLSNLKESGDLPQLSHESLDNYIKRQPALMSAASSAPQSPAKHANDASGRSSVQSNRSSNDVDLDRQLAEFLAASDNELPTLSDSGSVSSINESFAVANQIQLINMNKQPPNTFEQRSKMFENDHIATLPGPFSAAAYNSNQALKATPPPNLNYTNSLNWPIFAPISGNGPISTQEVHLPISKQRTKLPFKSAKHVETETTPQDFNILLSINDLVSYYPNGTVAYSIATGKSSRFVGKSNKVSFPASKRSIRSGSDRINNAINLCSSEFLKMNFPNIKLEYLNVLIDVCNCNLDQTFNVLLDWDYNEISACPNLRSYLLMQHLNDESGNFSVSLQNFSARHQVRTLFELCADCLDTFSLLDIDDLHWQIQSKSYNIDFSQSASAAVSLTCTDVCLPVSVDTISALESIFDPLPVSSLSEPCLVTMPFVLAENIYDCLKLSVFKGRDENILTENDGEIARRLQMDENDFYNKSSATMKIRNSSVTRFNPSFESVMLEEQITNNSIRQQMRNRPKGDSQLMQQRFDLLKSKYPGVEDSILISVLENTSYDIKASISHLNNVLELPENQRAQTTFPTSPAVPLKTRKTGSNVNLKKESNSLPLVQRSYTRQLSYDDFREEPQLYLNLRKDYLRKARHAFERKQYNVAVYYSQQANRLKDKILEGNKKAAKETFIYKNKDLDDSTIDLHGLHHNEVESILTQEFDSRQKRGVKWITVIVGIGKHSDGTKSRTLDQVTRHFLRKNEYRYEDLHPGALKVFLR